MNNHNFHTISSEKCNICCNRAKHLTVMLVLQLLIIHPDAMALRHSLPITFTLNQQFKAKLNKNKANLAYLCWYICYTRHNMEMHVSAASPHKLNFSVANSRAEEQEPAGYMAYWWVAVFLKIQYTSCPFSLQVEDIKQHGWPHQTRFLNPAV